MQKRIYLDNVCIPKWSIYKFPLFMFSEAITGSETLATETGSKKKKQAKREHETCYLILVKYDRRRRWYTVARSKPDLGIRPVSTTIT